jgi:hypothetical protein
VVETAAARLSAQRPHADGGQGAGSLRGGRRSLRRAGGRSERRRGRTAGACLQVGRVERRAGDAPLVITGTSDVSGRAPYASGCASLGFGGGRTTAWSFPPPSTPRRGTRAWIHGEGERARWGSGSVGIAGVRGWPTSGDGRRQGMADVRRWPTSGDGRRQRMARRPSRLPPRAAPRPVTVPRSPSPGVHTSAAARSRPSHAPSRQATSGRATSSSPWSISHRTDSRTASSGS